VRAYSLLPLPPPPRLGLWGLTLLLVDLAAPLLL
jgi:hypothetical protein